MFPLPPDPDDYGMPRDHGRDGGETPYDIPGEWRDAHGRWQRSPADPGADDFLVDEVDEALVDRVAERLIAEAEIRGRLVRVMVQNSVVILEGSVDSADDKAAAGRLAWATPGVFDVCNLLIVDR
ncbi:BON domain-containing protein [Actinoplanes sp. ATCC 53533]|uniref:BON domain-containing protein n=1 Tax=Actinoplanes sp. ATCC 53533 TaxID=1288362 RepID=UPI001315AE22|nr:BON domain-containing protein [Actinoplanes sp. ATCC 53533]